MGSGGTGDAVLLFAAACRCDAARWEATRVVAEASPSAGGGHG